MPHSYETIRDYVFTLQILDTHEHLPPHEHRRPQHDVLAEYLTHYFSCDLVSAGLSDAGLATARDSSQPLAKRWRTIEPFWNAARNTGYGRSLDITVRELYGLPRIDDETIEPLNTAFTAARAAGNTYRRVLKDKSNIRLSVLDNLYDNSPNVDREFFRPVVRLDSYILASSTAELAALGSPGAPIRTLADLEDAIEARIDASLAAGVVALKSGLAYVRPLRYEKTTRAQAEGQFVELFADGNVSKSHDGRSRGQLGLLQDYLMHHVCRLADARGMVFQVHTGLQEGNGNCIYHSDPAMLTNLFMQYPNVRFDLFHIGYPYQHTMAALAKNFRNVFIDFCWAHIISPAAAVEAMLDYLDAVPANKIGGFGGDYCFIDGVVGHQWMARENIARALAIKVDQGVFDLDRGRQLAKMILHDNPAALFGLEEKPAGGKKAKKK